MVFLALILNYIHFQLFIIFLKKNNSNEEKILMFKNAHKGNFLSFLVIGMSVITIFYTQPSSYTIHLSKSLAIFGPFTICIIGLIMLSSNILFNIKLINKIFKFKLD